MYLSVCVVDLGPIGTERKVRNMYSQVKLPRASLSELSEKRSALSDSNTFDWKQNSSLAKQ